jgi:DNA-binding response OmpR family regulator
MLREIWGYPDAPLTRSVDSAIGRLRKRIGPEPFARVVITAPLRRGRATNRP